MILDFALLTLFITYDSCFLTLYCHYVSTSYCNYGIHFLFIVIAIYMFILCSFSMPQLLLWFLEIIIAIYCDAIILCYYLICYFFLCFSSLPLVVWFYNRDCLVVCIMSKIFVYCHCLLYFGSMLHCFSLFIATDSCCLVLCPFSIPQMLLSSFFIYNHYNILWCCNSLQL